MSYYRKLTKNSFCHDLINISSAMIFYLLCHDIWEGLIIVIIWIVNVAYLLDFWC